MFYLAAFVIFAGAQSFWPVGMPGSRSLDRCSISAGCSIISALGYAGSRLRRALVLDIAGTGHGCHLAFSVGRGGRCVLEKEPLIAAQILPAEPLWRNQLSFKLGSTLPPPVSQPCFLGTQSTLRCGPEPMLLS